MVLSVCVSIATISACVQPHNMAHVAVALSVSPESLVIADAPLDAPDLIVTRLEACVEQLDSLLALDGAIAAVMALIQSNEEALLADPTLSTADLASAIGERDALTLERIQLASAVATAIVQDLPQLAVDGLARWRTAAAYRVPPEFRVLDRTEAEWRVIERAYRRCLAAEIRGEPPEPDDHALIGAIIAEPLVAAARGRLLTTFDAMTAAFEVHLGAWSGSVPD